MKKLTHNQSCGLRVTSYGLRALPCTFYPLPFTLLVCLSLALCAPAQGQQLRWHWAVQAMSKQTNHLSAVRCDTTGNIYLSGNFTDTLRFDTLAVYPSVIGQRNIFWAKFNSKGEVLWLKSAGGNNNDYPTAMSITPDGYIYTAGLIGKAALFEGQTVGNKNANLFVSCHNPDGTLQWVKSFDALRSHYITAIVADSSGNVYFSGYFDRRLTFDEQHQLTATGGLNAMLTSLDSLGNLRWTQQFDNASGQSRITALHLQGDALWVAGQSNTNLTVGNTAVQPRNPQEQTVFLTCCNLAGEIIKTYSNIISGGAAEVSSIALADKGLLVAGGNFADSLFIGAHTLLSHGNRDMFVAAIDTLGGVAWQQQLGSAAYDKLFEVVYHSWQHIIATGLYAGTLMVGIDTIALSNDFCDVFAASFNLEGQPQEINIMGGTAEEYPLSIARDPEGHIFVAGIFRDTTGVNTTRLVTATGKNELFLAKLYHCNKHRIVFSCDTVFSEGTRLTLKLKDNYKNYTWDDGASQSPMYIIEYSKTYQVLVSDSIGCVYRDSITIRQEPLIPQLQIRADLPFKFQKNNTVARFAKQIEAITPF
ncbi:MAG: hypothetical protein LBH91_04920, partial [Prevotellaceae bacterium]|nr:hypothetical protein [Prevotellaceae bacterium]